MPRTPRCTYREGNRRCPMDGTGNPALCTPHRVALQAAARPKSPIEQLGHTVMDLLNGTPINKEATLGAAQQLFSQLSGLGDGYMPNVMPGESEHTAHRRGQAGNPIWGGRRWDGPPGWGGRPQAQPPVDPEAEELARVRAAARQVLGFTQDERLNEDQINQRKRQLAKKYHPDRQGGSVEKMAAINNAADVLIAAL